MKIIAEQAALARAAGRIANVAPRRTTALILGNVLIDARDGEVWLYGTDQSMEIRERLEAEIITPGWITLGSATLSEIARAAPAGSQIAVTYDQATEVRAVVQAGRSKYKLPVLPGEDFPLREVVADAAPLNIEAAELLTLLDHVHFAQSSDETRYYLIGVHFSTVAEEGRPVFRTVAVDGHRMSIDQRPLSDGQAIPGVIVPKPAVTEFRRLLQGAKGQVQMLVARNAISFELDDTRLIANTVDGVYPDYERVWVRTWEQEIIIDRVAFQSAIRRASLISNEKARPAKIVVDDDSLTVTVRNLEMGEASETIEVIAEGPRYEGGFNAKYLLDILEQTDADQMVLRVRDSGSPVRLDPHPSHKGGETIVNVVMPLRI